MDILIESYACVNFDCKTQTGVIDDGNFCEIDRY